MTYNVLMGTINPTHSLTPFELAMVKPNYASIWPSSAGWPAQFDSQRL